MPVVNLHSSGATFSPADISGLTLWAKADALVLSNDDPVSSWADSSGNGNALVQADSARRPVFKTSILNGLPVVRFDYVDDFLSVAFALTQPSHVFIVARMHAGAPADDTLLDGATNNSMRVFRSASTTMQMYAGNFGPALTTTPESFHAYGFLFNGASSEARVDGGAAATGNCGANNGGGLTLSSAGSGSQPGGADIGEVLVYDSSLSAGNQTLLFAYIAGKWATP